MGDWDAVTDVSNQPITSELPVIRSEPFICPTNSFRQSHPPARFCQFPRNLPIGDDDHGQPARDSADRPMTPSSVRAARPALLGSEVSRLGLRSAISKGGQSDRACDPSGLRHGKRAVLLVRFQTCHGLINQLATTGRDGRSPRRSSADRIPAAYRPPLATESLCGMGRHTWLLC